MDVSFAWPSVSVNRRLEVVVNIRMVRCAGWDTFVEVLEKVDLQLASVSVEKVLLCCF